MGPELLLGLFVALVAVAFFAQRRGEKKVRAERAQVPEEQGAPGVLPIEDAIDLHGFRPKEIPDVVESYLEAAHERGFREVRLIHGRGKGVQRQRVRSLLARHPLVEHYTDAPAHRGGWGAQMVTLKPRRR